MSVYNKGAEPDQQENWGDIVRQIVILVVVIFGVRSFFIEPFNIPSGSMIPTLQIGDFVLVTKPSYGYSRYSFPFSFPLFSGRVFGSLPHRGDVAVFRYTQDTSIDYIKRIVGLPGDHIRVTAGKLILNGQELPRQSMGPYSFRDEMGTHFSGERYRETLTRENGKGSVTHDVLKLTDEGPANNTTEYVVPQGCLFAMGDDRDDSSDSRFQGGRETGKCAAPAGNDFLRASDRDLGFVPVENLVGHAQFVLFSIDLKHPSWQFWYWPAEIRWGRFLHGVH